MSCGHNFLILLSSCHQIYSYGDNSHGQLGYPCASNYSQLKQVSFNKSANTITNIQCGYSHTIAYSNR